MSSSASDAVPFSLDGERLEGRVGDSLAAALLRAGVTTFTRSIKYHRPRGPFCLSGTCGQCLVRVDGVPSLPACRIELRAGMACERQNAPLGLIEQDLFRAVDFLYPEGLDHHHLMIQSRLMGRVALEVARRLAGLGTLPAHALPPQPGVTREVPLVIVGAGPAGLAAARGAARSARVLLIERSARVGGAARLFSHERGMDTARLRPDDLEAQARALGDGVELLCDAEVIGLYADEHASGPALLAVRSGARLLAVRARRVLLATGGALQPLPFPGVDRPGVYAARGLLELFQQSGVLVGAGKPLALVGTGEELQRCARALLACGYALTAAIDIGERAPSANQESSELPRGVDGTSSSDLPRGVEQLVGSVVRARGRPVAELQVALRPASGRKLELRKLRCGAVALALPPAPLHELGSSVGATAQLREGQAGFALEVDADGRTGVPWLFAAGTVAGQGLLELPASDRRQRLERAERAGAEAAAGWDDRSQAPRDRSSPQSA